MAKLKIVADEIGAFTEDDMKYLAKRARVSVLYAEKYRRGAAMIKEHLLPNLPHIDGDKFAVHSGEIREAGRVKCPDGVTREFQTITFLLSDRE